jgi:hypothetical protein
VLLHSLGMVAGNSSGLVVWLVVLLSLGVELLLSSGLKVHLRLVVLSLRVTLPLRMVVLHLRIVLSLSLVVVISLRLIVLSLRLILRDELHGRREGLSGPIVLPREWRLPHLLWHSLLHSLVLYLLVQLLNLRIAWRLLVLLHHKPLHVSRISTKM